MPYPLARDARRRVGRPHAHRRSRCPRAAPPSCASSPIAPATVAHDDEPPAERDEPGSDDYGSVRGSRRRWRRGYAAPAVDPAARADGAVGAHRRRDTAARGGTLPRDRRVRARPRRRPLLLTYPSRGWGELLIGDVHRAQGAGVAVPMSIMEAVRENLIQFASLHATHRIGTALRLKCGFLIKILQAE